MLKSPAQTSPGFTLVELIVAVSILTIISAASIPNFSTFIKSQNLVQAQESVKNGIRDAQNRAITGEDSTSVLCDGGTAVCTHWVVKLIKGGSTYAVGKSNGVGALACDALDTTDFVSDKFPGDVVINMAGLDNDACIFYEFLTADESDYNLECSGTAVQALKDGLSKYVVVNSSGLVMGANACP